MGHDRTSRLRSGPVRCFVELLERRRLLAAVSLNPGTAYQTIQGWGVAPMYPDSIPVATAGAIMRDAGMNTVRISACGGCSLLRTTAR